MTCADREFTLLPAGYRGRCVQLSVRTGHGTAQMDRASSAGELLRTAKAEVAVGRRRVDLGQLAEASSRDRAGPRVNALASASTIYPCPVEPASRPRIAAWRSGAASGVPWRAGAGRTPSRARPARRGPFARGWRGLRCRRALCLPCPPIVPRFVGRVPPLRLLQRHVCYGSTLRHAARSSRCRRGLCVTPGMRRACDSDAVALLGRREVMAAPRC